MVLTENEGSGFFPGPSPRGDAVLSHRTPGAKTLVGKLAARFSGASDDPNRPTCPGLPRFPPQRAQAGAVSNLGSWRYKGRPNGDETSLQFPWANEVPTRGKRHDPSSENALLHLAVWALIGLLVAAVLLGRGTAGRAAKKSLPPLRHPAHPRYHAFSGYLFPDDHPHQTRLLDTETGDVTLLDVTQDEGFDAVSCSPWQDERGQYHLVGRRRAPKISDLEGFAGGSLGTTRCTFPGGEILDRLSFELILASPPCWFPDRSDRILFAGCDGRLYDLTFPGTEGPRDSPTIRPRRIRWRTHAPGNGVLHIQDPCWPSEQILGGHLLVAIRFRKVPAQSFDGPQLWWLQLSENGTAIVAAGPLIVPSRNASNTDVTWGEERCPSVGMTHDGVPMIAYTTLPEGQHPGGLWIAPITFKSRGGNRIPRVEADTARLVTSTCIAAR